MIRTLFLAPALLLAAIGAAQKPVEASGGKLAAVQAAHKAMVAARDTAQTELRALSSKARGASPEERKDLMAKAGDIRKQMTTAQEAFQKAFASCGWQNLDPGSHADLLKDGLPALAGDIEKSPKDAVAASRMFLEHFGSEPVAKQIRSMMLPYALLACGQADQAIEGLNEVAEAASGAEKARTLITIGDLHATQGDVAKATSSYEAAGEAADNRTKGYVDLRLALTGKPAPDIDSDEWIGGKARPLSALKGTVVLVDFWATWCPPCRAVMPGLSKLYEERSKDGLMVLGVTRFYKNGYLPADKEQMSSGGEQVNDLTEETFPDHVKTFKENTGIAYPFVIGVEEDFKNYRVSGIPTLIVVGPDGNVALVTVGSGSEPLVKATVDRLLAK